MSMPSHHRRSEDISLGPADIGPATVVILEYRMSAPLEDVEDRLAHMPVHLRCGAGGDFTDVGL
jgi:hypothetical protein